MEEGIKNKVLKDIEKRYGKDSLCYKLYNIEPKIDLLHQLTGCDPRLTEVTVSSDGFFMGREVGDIGFNAWLGKPSQTAMDRTSRLFEQLDHESQKEVVEKLYSAFRNTAPDFSKIGLSKAQVDKIYDKEKIKSDRSMLDNPQHHAFEQT